MYFYNLEARLWNADTADKTDSHRLIEYSGLKWYL